MTDQPTLTNADRVAQHVAAARFLDSHGVLAITTLIKDTGRVEVIVDAPGWIKLFPALVDLGATHHPEPAFLFLEARIDGVPVQVGVSKPEREDYLSALVERTNQRLSDFDPTDAEMPSRSGVSVVEQHRAARVTKVEARS